MNLESGKNMTQKKDSYEILNYQKIFDKDNQLTELNRLRNNENVNLIIAEEKTKWEKDTSVQIQEAFEKGYEKSSLEGKLELDKQSILFKKMYNELNDYWYKDKEEFTSFLMEVAVNLAQEIVGTVEVSDEYIDEQNDKLMEVIGKVEKNLKPNIEVSNNDIDSVKSLINNSGLEQMVSLRPNSELLPGEFVIDTNKERWINTRKGLLEAFGRKD
tara:strand:- start:10473 stop:11117 length:645 start_codon:yes stop_codon:yes gene_type:complete